ncbi:hypothetical protein HYZ41_00055 [archaeon]|nr:hypothetical protein [archaeon]
MKKICGTLIALTFFSPMISQFTNKYIYDLNVEESAAVTYVNYGVGRGAVYDILYGTGASVGHLICYGQDVFDNLDKTKNRKTESEAFDKIIKKINLF